MRKTIYGISIFFCILAILFMCDSYKHMHKIYAQMEELKVETGKIQEQIEESTTWSMPSEGKTIQQGYYLLNIGNRVYVYRGDRTTLYEKTSIMVSGLPKKLQSEIEKGKYLPSELELYSFLENYSS